MKKQNIKFDLENDIQPVISFNIEKSDDVRDKVALSFFHRLGESSDLKIVFTEDEFNIKGIIIPVPA